MDDENESQEASDDFPTAGDDSVSTSELQTRQIEWLLRKVTTQAEQLTDLEQRVTEAAANLPTPESVAALVEQATTPTREAMETALSELQASMSPTPDSPETPTNPATDQNTQAGSIRTEAPPESAGGSPEAEAPQNPAPQEKATRIIRV